jgi:DNA-binding NarL/FixJ family response regulator
MIRLLVADETYKIRTAVRGIVALADDIMVGGEETNYEGIVRQLASQKQDVILLDDFIPPFSSAEAAHGLRELGVELPILVLAVIEDAKRLQRELDSGVNGIVFKQELLRELLPAIRTVARGENYLSPLSKKILAQE